MIIPIPDIKWTFEQLLKLFNMDYTTRKDRFEKIFEPTFSNLVTIHRDYNNMFNRILKILPTHNADNETTAFVTIFDKDNEPVNFIETERDSIEYKDNLKRAKTIIDEDRKLNDFLRIEARELSAMIIKKGHNRFEKIFSWTILEYFLNKNYLPDNEEEFFKDLETKGPDFMLDTPSYLISYSISNTTNSEDIKNLIKNVKMNIGDKFVNFISAYNDLKLETYD